MIIYDTIEVKVKYITHTYEDSMHNEVYVADDGKEYGIGKKINYIRLDEDQICKIINKCLNK